jgi:hypothetical protein
MWFQRCPGGCQTFDAWSKLNAPRIGTGGANDEDDGGARRARKQGKKK